MKIRSLWLLVFLLPLSWGGAVTDHSASKAGWGVDAVLSRHIRDGEMPAYIQLLRNGEIRVLRERDVGNRLPDGAYKNDVRPHYLQLKQAGFSITASAGLPTKKKPADPANVLLEDLREVYFQGKILGADFAGLVDTWEMVGEPDLGYCPDLPDRVAAYQKALYLGIKEGSKERGAENKTQDSGFRTQVSPQEPIVLMGALGMPPGPWLERAAANDLLDYTDAYNFHFYGHAEDLTGVIAAHRAAIATLRAKSEGWETADGLATSATALPMWITEAGIEAVDKKDWLNKERRQLQAEFTISTAKQALAAEDVAVFMPFILVHDKDPYAMTLSPWKTFPAWDAYAKFTRENPWPKRALSREQGARSSIVMQWLPDNRTAVPHKVSGTYRFKSGQPIKGELRVYNFGERTVSGRFEAGLLKNVSASLKAEGGKLKAEDPITIPSMGMTAIPLEFTATAGGYFRETFVGSFVEENPQLSGFRSQVSFGLEAQAKPEDFTEEPLLLRALPEGKIRFPQIEPYMSGEQVGVWTTMNGLRGEAARSETGNLKSETVGFWIEKENTDPLAPEMAVAAVAGLPVSGFIRLQLDKPMTKERKVLVVLVDDRGQRYTIWENFGADYYGSRSDIWLNLEDFHADFWGPMSADYQFRPERVREVHLRLYLNTPNDRVGLELALLKAK